MSISIPRILAALAFIGLPSPSTPKPSFAGDQGVVHALTQTGTVSFRGVSRGPVSSMVVHDGTLTSAVFYNYDVATSLSVQASSSTPTPAL
ncbi:MAG: hypothetical protein R3B67_00285 [Phycisphaerales bacterium]